MTTPYDAWLSAPPPPAKQPAPLGELLKGATHAQGSAR